MSPASSGSLEVERYIGACLITSQNQGRHKKSFVGDQQRFLGCNNPGNVENWAGGMPLFSYHQRWRRDTSYNPLSRLAVHTQGAPLILSNRYNNNKKKFASKSNTNKFFEHLSKPDLNSNNNNVSVAPDSVSVTSDESSGSNNSETCLPRIIKPRKRRKKDRKPPPHLLRPINCQDGSYSTDSTSPDVDIDSPQIISFVPYFTYLNHNSDPVESFADPTPNLHHSFEDLEDFDLNGNQTEGTCQCKYCDPTGQIWDMDRSCYSPYLTSPEKHFSPAQSSSLLSKSCSSSLLDCFSSLSLDNRSAPPTNSTVKSSRGLEVSTEIVTSLNGHRDLEIRFFTQKSRTKDISRYTHNFLDDASVVNS